MLERARALPGVRSAALTSNVPLSLNYNYSSIYLEGQSETNMSKLPVAIPISVSPGFFKTMRISLRGRDFAENEDKKESRVAVVNETFAKKFFPNQDPIGKRFNFTGPKDPLWQVIGVWVTANTTASAKLRCLPGFARNFVITIPFAHLVRTNGDPRSLFRHSE